MSECGIDCDKCAVCDFKESLCEKDFCEKYGFVGKAEDFVKRLESEIDGLKNQIDDLSENLAWYINERQRLLKVIEYSKPNEGLQRTIKKALERPHGEWIFAGVCHDENNPIDSDTYYCSICKRSISTSLTRPEDLFPFCHCGADMRPKEGGTE